MSSTRKHSRKRDAILDCIRKTDTHPTAEWVYNQLKPDFPELSLGTVYRNLNLFRQEGEIASVGVVKGWERFDGTTRPHVHFICAECGCVYDVNIDPPTDLAQQVGTSLGGTVESCALTFTGLCKVCCHKKQNKMNSFGGLT